MVYSVSCKESAEATISGYGVQERFTAHVGCKACLEERQRLSVKRERENRNKRPKVWVNKE